MITLEQAKSLKSGTILYHTSNKNADNTPQRWRVNGAVKTWKRSPERVQVPLKHGLRTYDYLTEDTLDLLTLNEDDAAL
jgi:hypothetical protein